MEIKEITYKDKIAIEEDPDYPEENQVTDENMNEIKEVVNYNGKKLKEVSEIELQTLQEENKKLKSALINVETEEAKSLHIEDASEVPAQLKVMGNQEQETSTQGKNYFTGNKIASGTAFGVTYSFDNSILKANGTSTVSGSIVLDADTGVKLPAGTYTYTVKKVAGDYTRQNGQDFALYLKNDSDWITGDYATSGITGSNLQNNTGIYSRQITITEETEIYFRFYVSGANIVFNDLELEIQIESGSEYTEFEQFIPNMPSPNYPSEVVCLGSNKNEIGLQEIQETTTNGITYRVENEKIYLNGVSTKASFIDISLKKEINLNNKKVFRAILENIIENNNNKVSLWLSNSENENLVGNLWLSSLDNVLKTTKLDKTATKIRIYIAEAGITFNTEIKTKLEKGEIATSYSPYRTR